MGKPYLTTIQIDGTIHKRLQLIAADQTVRSGKRVSLRALTEIALLAKYPMLAGSGGAGSASASASGDGQDEQASTPDPNVLEPAQDVLDGRLFEQIVEAVYIAPDAAAQSRAIEALIGTVPGSMGNKIPLKELAYHLRSTDKGIDSLPALISDYEGNESKGE